MSDPYALEPEPELPSLPGEPVIRETEDFLLDVLVADVYLHALNCVQQFGDFHMAIAVGPFQERLCRRLMTDPAVRQLPWQRTHLWAVADAPDRIWGSRFTSILDLLEGHSGIPDSNLHAPDLGAADPAADYERRLQEVLAWREKGHDRLDLAVLSLTPGGGVGEIEPAADANGRLYRPRVSPGEATAGIAMTHRLLNATRLIAVAALGEQCRAALSGAAEHPATPRPIGGTVRWYVDKAACPA
jgi:6-phosphogluconolactonase